MRASVFTYLLLVALVGLAGVEADAAWVPVPCAERADEIEAIRERAGEPGGFSAIWQRYEQSVRNAQPGERKYVPRPYPQAAHEVFEDFRHAFLTRLATDPLNVAPRHRRTYDALQSGEIRYEIVRVENWDPGRCGGDRPVPFYHLVRLFDDDGEIARCALHESGHFSIFAPLDDRKWPLDDLAEIGGTVRQRFGVETKPSGAQLVTLSGLPVRCTPVAPCVAFRSEGRTFLVNHDHYLFAIEPDAPRLGVLELAQRPVDPRALAINAGRRATPWISVGFGAREGRLVAIGPKGTPLD